jgi:hypothetical protein
MSPYDCEANRARNAESDQCNKGVSDDLTPEKPGSISATTGNERKVWWRAAVSDFPPNKANQTNRHPNQDRPEEEGVE